MPRKLIFFLFLSFFFLNQSVISIGQVSINTSSTPPDPSSMLDIESSTKGVLIPRLTEIQKNNITDPSHSLLIFQTDGDSGFYYNSGTPLSPIWLSLATGTSCGAIRIPIDTLPYTITTSGSYYVTESLNASSGSNGITITTSNVTIDLNGNGLIGDGLGTNAAIISSGAIAQINIFNGFISNWGGHGINATSASSTSISQVQVDGCGYSGINLGVESMVYNCKSSNNGLDGISTNNSSTVANCISIDNGADGIDVGSYCTIINCHAKTNQGNGLETGSTCQIKDCLSFDNNDNGVYLGSGSTVTGCISSSNTLSGFEMLTGSKGDSNTARSNSSNGFTISNDVFVTNCSADNNTLSGFFCDSNDARIDNNQSTDNGQHGFSVTGTGNVILRNSSSGNISLSFNILAGNTSGTVLTSASFNTNSNPYANIAF